MINREWVPNFFSFLRIFLVYPILVLLMNGSEFSKILALAIFTFAALTDFYDGYFARKYQAESWFGIFIDPFADKILVHSILGFYCFVGIIGFVPVLITAARDIFITGFRIFKGAKKRPMPASMLGKFKAGLQFTLIYLIMGYQIGLFTEKIPANFLFFIINCLIALIAIYSAYKYLINGFKFNNSSFKKGLEKISIAISTCFGVGFFPFFPGTLGSILGLACWLVFPTISLLPFILICLVIFFIGTAASQKTSLKFGVEDPSFVVVDEFLGMIISVAMLPKEIFVALGAIVFFRIFDILKPWPIYLIEKIPGGWGIMLDDVAAGLCARFVMFLIIAYF
jgi:phosphatidylglycerophosphatase A